MKVTLKVMLNSEATPKLANFDSIIYYSLFIFSETAENDHCDNEEDASTEPKRPKLETTVTMEHRKQGGRQTTLHVEQGSSWLMVKMPFPKTSSGTDTDQATEVSKKIKKAKILI